MSDTKKKLFIPRKITGENSRWVQWNKEQPIVDGKPINQYTHDGKKTGIWEEYHNGKLWSKGPYKDDIAEGEWEWYWTNGNLLQKGNYKDGNREDIWESYWDNGKLEEKGSFKDDLKDGIWEEYDISGNLVFKGLYKDDELVKILPLNESETPKKKLFVPRRLSGENSKWMDWNKMQPIVDGIQINQYTHDGKKTGYWEKYYDNGQLDSKGPYKNGKREGYWEYYYDDGGLMSKGYFKNNEKDGIWEDYFGNGQLMYRSAYDNGINDGIWEAYYNNGQLRNTGSYINDNREGIWEFYNKDGKLEGKGLYKNGNMIKELPLTESETPSFLLKEEMTLIREGKIEDYINNILSKIKNLPYETKKKYLTIAISTLLGYTSYPVIQSIFDNSPDKEAKEIVHRVMDKKDKFSMFKDGTKLHLSKKGFNHIVNEEKPKLIAYALGDGKITIGYGHAEPIGKTKLKVGQKISEEQAKQYLKQDLKTAADGVRRMFDEWKQQDKNFKVTQDMFDALVSLAFNIGVSGLRQTDMVKHLKNGDYKTAGEIIKQTKIDPDTFPGLEKRRGRESNMFLSYLSQNNKINA